MENSGNSYQGRDVLVVGASGFIGRWIARLLTEAGANIQLISRDPYKLESVCREYAINGQIVKADLAVPGTFARLSSAFLPDITFNASGYGVYATERDSGLMARVNDDLPGEIVRALSDSPCNSDWSGQRFVHTGTSAEYGMLQNRIVETRTPAPSTLYGKSKLAGTLRIQKTAGVTGVKAIIARLTTIYGPGEGSGRLLPSLLRASVSGNQVELTQGRQERDFTWVGDVAEGLLRLGLTEGGICQVVNLATGRLMTVRDFIEIAAEALEISASQLAFGALPYRRDEVMQGPVSVERLKQLTAWVPSTCISDGVKATREFHHTDI